MNRYSPTIRRFYFAAGLALQLPGRAWAQTAPPPEVALVHPGAGPVSPGLAGFSEQQVLEAWGWITAEEKEVAHAELSASELAAFERGITAGCQGREPGYDLPTISPDVERLSLARRAKFRHSVEEIHRAAARAFFDALASRPNIKEAPGGWRYEIMRPGAGSLPKPEQTVMVHYVGRLIDGTEFTEIGHYDLVLVKNRLLLPLLEGIQKISQGGAIRLYVPPVAPDAEETRPGVPRGVATVYELEVLDIKATPPDDLANSLLPPAPELPPLPPSGAGEEQIIEAWGWITARKAGAAELGLNESEVAAFWRGITAGIKGEAGSLDGKKIRPVAERYVSDRRARARFAVRQKRISDMNELFAELEKNPQIVELPDGLRYQILQPGTGPKPKPGQIVVVDYTGRLIDGTIFDKTYNEPLHVEIGSVIPGLNEGFQKISKGGRITLYVPPSIGYGDENVSGVVSRIPASSLLIYEIELLDIENQPAGQEVESPKAP